MEEENKTEEKQEEQPEEKAAPTNILDEARKERKMLEEQLDRREKLVEREEAIAATNTLGGTSDAGQAPEPKKEMTPEEYKDSIMKGEIPE